MEDYINLQIEKMGIIEFAKILIVIGIIGVVGIGVLTYFSYKNNMKKIEQLKNSPDIQTVDFESYRNNLERTAKQN